MNILGLVFSILLTLLFTLGAIFEQQISSHLVQSSYVNHRIATRNILSAYESKLYSSFAGKSSQDSLKNPPLKKSPSQKSTPKKISYPETNPLCSRINLLPLIVEGKEKQMALFRLVEELFNLFYLTPLFNGDQKKERLFIQHFIEALTKASLSDQPIILEKLEFLSHEERLLYYKMLKGTKQSNLFEKIGYPSLLEYVKLSLDTSLPCLFDAHPHLIAIYFDPEVAKKLYEEIHKEEPSLLTTNLIEQLYLESRKILDPKIFEFLHLSTCACKQKKETTLTGSDAEGKIFLKKTIKL